MIVAGKATKKSLIDAGDRTLLQTLDGKTRTGLELLDRIEKLASALVAVGAAEQRVGLWMWNSPSTFEAHLAVERIGGTRVAVDPSAPPEEVRIVMAAAKAHVLITDLAHAGLVESMVHDEEEPLSGSSIVDEFHVDPDKPHLLYPRMVVDGQLLAVPISYSNWYAQIDINLGLYRKGWYGPPLAKDDVAITAQQLIHATGMVMSFPFLAAGLSQVILPKFTATDFIEAAQRFNGSTSFFVPGMITRLVEALEDDITLPLRRILYGGAPFTLEEMVPSIKRLGPVLIQLYGRLEGGWPITVLGADDHTAIAEGDVELARSCGKPIPEIETNIREVTGSPNGEFRVRGRSVVREYADPDGWCGLGDLVTTNDDGYFFLQGRLDGMINTGSYHVYPAEIEAAITSLPGITGAKVRGEDDPKWGQAVTAYVIADDLNRTSNELNTELRSKLASYKIPKKIKFVSSLPT